MGENRLKLFKKLHKVQSEVGMIYKAAKNSSQNYKFVKLEHIIEKLQPLLSQEKLYLYCDQIGDSEILDALTTKAGWKTVKVRIKATIVDIETGEELSVESNGTANDGADKAEYKAITGGRKYATANLLNLVTTDDPEKDEKKQEVKKVSQSKPAVNQDKLLKAWGEFGIKQNDLEKLVNSKVCDWTRDSIVKIREYFSKIKEISDPKARKNYITDVFQLEPGSLED